MTFDMLEHDYYEILQVHPKATLAVIKKAYRTLLLDQGQHPDQGGSAAAAARLTEAYQVLCDPERRAAYDRQYFKRMSQGPAPEPEGRRTAPKQAPPTAPTAGEGALIVLCPRCRTKNRVRSQELLAIARCSRCRQHLNTLPNPLADLKEHLHAALAERLGRAKLPKWLKIGIPVLMLGASLAAIAAAFHDDWSIGDPLERAEHLQRDHLDDQAAELLQKALDREPNNPRLYEKLGDVYTKQLLYDQAVIQYAKAIRLNPSNSYLYTLQGNAYWQLKRLAEAELSYKNALKLDPQQAPALVALGNVYAQQQRFDEAARLYQQALRERASGDVLYNLGLVYQWEGRRAQAINAFRQALIADPNHRASMVSLAALYYEQHQYDLAAAQLIKANTLKHGDLDLHLKLADIYERTGRTQQAIQEWNVCLEQGKQNPAVMELARRALQRLGVSVG